MRTFVPFMCVLGFVFCFAFSCNRNRIEEDSAKTILINNLLIKDTFDISDFIDTLSVISLEEQVDNPLTSPYQLYTFGDRGYLIFNIASNSKKLFFFDKKGAFVKTVAKNGIGEDDGINMLDAYENDSVVIVYDFAKHSLNVYDSALNLFAKIKGTSSHRYSHVAMIPHSNSFVGFANFNLGSSSRSQVDIITESSLNVKKSYFYYPRRYSDLLVLTYNNSFFLYRDSLRFFKYYDPSIYHIEKNGVWKIFDIKYKAGNIEPEQVDSIFDRNIKTFSAANSINRKKNGNLFKGFTFPYERYLENEKFIFLSSINNTTDSSSIFNSLIVKTTLKDTFSTRQMTERSKYKICIPPFSSYDKQTDEFLVLLTGYELKKRLLPGSQLISAETINPQAYYLIKIRLK